MVDCESTVRYSSWNLVYLAIITGDSCCDSPCSLFSALRGGAGSPFNTMRRQVVALGRRGVDSAFRRHNRAVVHTFSTTSSGGSGGPSDHEFDFQKVLGADNEASRPTPTADASRLSGVLNDIIRSHISPSSSSNSDVRHPLTMLSNLISEFQVPPFLRNIASSSGDL